LHFIQIKDDVGQERADSGSYSPCRKNATALPDIWKSDEYYRIKDV